MSTNGTLQLIVNLRSQSVEYSGEVGDNRNSCVLKSDIMNADEIIEAAQNSSEAAGMNETEILELTISSINELVGQLGILTSFTLTRAGNKVVIRAKDISFITVATTGVFRDIQEAS